MNARRCSLLASTLLAAIGCGGGVGAGAGGTAGDGSGALAVEFNPKLPACHATAVRDQLVGFTGTVSVSGNLGTCP